MKKTVEIIVHTFFWIIYTAITLMLSKVYLQAKPDAPFSDQLVYVISLELFMGLLFFYITFWGISWTKGKTMRVAILAFILLFLLLFFSYPAMRIGVWEVMSSILPHIILVFLAAIFRKFSDSVQLEQEKQNLMYQNMQSELALLKMQLSPHFLFNTLNNIDYLVHTDADKASDTLAKLGAILRYMIYDAAVDKIDLCSELSQIEDYIGLIKLRVKDEKYLKYKLSGNCQGLRIAPMLFVPLIENAYKHSASKEGENIISLEIQISGRNLLFNICNAYKPDEREPQKHSGLGMNIVKRRLELIYPNRHEIIISTRENVYTVELSLELDENEMHSSR